MRRRRTASGACWRPCTKSLRKSSDNAASSLLRDLGAGSGEAKTAEEACVIAANVFARYPHDVPFALFYLLDREGRAARLAAVAGGPPGGTGMAAAFDLTVEHGADGWPFAEAVRTEIVQLVGEPRRADSRTCP